MANRLDVLTLAAAAVVAVASFDGTLGSAPEPPAQAAALAPPPAPRSPARPPAPACAPLDVPMPELLAVPDLDRPIPPIEDPTGEALAPFFEKLARFLRGRAKDHLRLGVYGDSNGTLDYLTGEMRRYLQGRWGDAGHGYIALAQVWPWYEHRDVLRGADAAWEGHAVSTNWVDDGGFGHGMIVAEASKPNAETWVATAPPPAAIGLTADRAEVWYLRRPGGGAFDVVVDGETRATVSTDAPSVEAGFAALEMTDDAHRVAYVTREARPVRLLGAVLERAAGEHPSFVVDGLGVGGASFRTMLRDDPAIDAQTLRHRAYDLLVLHMGTNTWKGEWNRAATMRAVIARLHAALPETPILVMDPPDHHDDYAIMDEELPPEQRKIALSTGCAFFDFHAAMGGRHAMNRFWVNGMSRGDVVHFNEKGGAYMARRVLYAIFRELAAWLQRHPRAGCG